MEDRPDVSKANAIMAKWDQMTGGAGGFFLRHLDGDLKNHDSKNLQRVHPFDCFTALYEGEEHADTWVVSLTDDEIDFVKQYAWNFMVTYQAVGRAPVEPPIDRSESEYMMQLEEQMQQAMKDPEVSSLSEQGDAAMAAGDYEKAFELYEKAKGKRDELMPVMEGEGEMIFTSQTNSGVSSASSSLMGLELEATATPKKAPMHGRRAAGAGDGPPRRSILDAARQTNNNNGDQGQGSVSSRPSIISAAPGRRAVQNGMTKKEEVEARIRARNESLR